MSADGDTVRLALHGDEIAARAALARLEAAARGACPNGPDEHGDWPCDPIAYGTDGIATCSVCRFEAAWPPRSPLLAAVQEIAFGESGEHARNIALDALHAAGFDEMRAK